MPSLFSVMCWRLRQQRTFSDSLTGQHFLCVLSGVFNFCCHNYYS